MDNHQVTTSLKWDAHACLPLHRDSLIKPLERYLAAGVSYVSINVGMDMNPLTQVMLSLAAFRAQIIAHPQMSIAGSLSDIRTEADQGRLSVGFDLEGALPLLDSPDMVAIYRSLGVRQIHLAYNRNNRAAGGCHDVDVGLTSLGGQLVDAMNRVGILVDCSHMSMKSSLDAIERSVSPAIFSHANPAELVPHERNINDAQIRAIAQYGGVVCLNGVNLFLGHAYPTLNELVRHICYVADLVGVEHTGVGLDVSFSQDGIDDTPPGSFDPQYWWPEHAGYQSGISTVRYLQPESWGELPTALQSAGMSTQEVDLVLGENMARVLGEVEAVAAAHP